jgi:hypothetical protein
VLERCPHVIGANRDGREQCLCYQFGGGSRSGLAAPGSVDNWRCVAIGALDNVSLRDGPWHTGPNYSERQSCVERVDVEVPDQNGAGPG